MASELRIDDHDVLGEFLRRMGHEETPKLGNRFGEVLPRSRKTPVVEFVHGLHGVRPGLTTVLGEIEASKDVVEHLIHVDVNEGSDGLNALPVLRS